MDGVKVEVEIYADQISTDGNTSAENGSISEEDDASEGNDKPECAKLLRKPLSPITRSYREMKYHCKQCGAEFTKKLDMHIHRLTHAEEAEKDNLSCDCEGSDLTQSLYTNNKGINLMIGVGAQENFQNTAVHSSASVMKCSSFNADGPSDVEFDGSLTGIQNQNFTSNEQQAISSDSEASNIDSVNAVVPYASKRTYQCAPCNKKFLDYSLYLQHRGDHPNPKLFKCPTCTKGFTSKGNMTRHQQIHNDIRDFQCNLCEKKFSQKTHLVAHLGTHTKKASYSCRVCEASFHKEHDRLMHEATTHVPIDLSSGIDSSNETTSRFIDWPPDNAETSESNSMDTFDEDTILDTDDANNNLNGAKLESGSDTALVKYYRNIHYTCGTCSEVFFDFQTYIAHKKKHPTPKLYGCDQCGKSFTVKGNLQRHIQIHQDIRLHACNICHKKFSQKTHLAAHMHVHSKERPYLCSLCGVSFTREGNLRRHVKMHLGIKKDSMDEQKGVAAAYKCDECCKSFMKKGNLTRHKKEHTRQLSHISDA